MATNVVRDGFNDEDAGHDVHIILPDEIFLRTIGKKYPERIIEDFRANDHTPGEFIYRMFFDMQEGGPNWRNETGLLLKPARSVAPDVAKRIWGSGFRLFLSHKSEYKVDVGQLKIGLRLFGISAFVAHEDIQPSLEWKDEIENALSSMEAFAACVLVAASELREAADVQIGSQKLSVVRETVKAWPKLSPELRAAMFAVGDLTRGD